jgi:hypothetical protein
MIPFVRLGEPDLQTEYEFGGSSLSVYDEYCRRLEDLMSHTTELMRLANDLDKLESKVKAASVQDLINLGAADPFGIRVKLKDDSTHEIYTSGKRVTKEKMLELLKAQSVKLEDVTHIKPLTDYGDTPWKRVDP